MKPMLEFILSELMYPFKKFRKSFSEENVETLFFKMTLLSPFRYQMGSILFGLVTKIPLPTTMIVKLESGIEASVYSYEVSEKETNLDLTKEFYEGQTIVARIVNLSYESYKTDFNSIIKISLSLKPSVLNNHKDYILALHSNLDEYNSIGILAFIFKGLTLLLDPNNDYPIMISNKRKKGNFVDRMIMHNKFKNITTEEAIALLEDKDVGDVFFFIDISWFNFF